MITILKFSRLTDDLYAEILLHFSSSSSSSSLGQSLLLTKVARHTTSIVEFAWSVMVILKYLDDITSTVVCSIDISYILLPRKIDTTITKHHLHILLLRHYVHTIYNIYNGHLTYAFYCFLLCSPRDEIAFQCSLASDWGKWELQRVLYLVYFRINTFSNKSNMTNKQKRLLLVLFQSSWWASNATLVWVCRCISENSSNFLYLLTQLKLFSSYNSNVASNFIIKCYYLFISFKGTIGPRVGT